MYVYTHIQNKGLVLWLMLIIPALRRQVGSRVQGQPTLYSEILSPKTNKKKLVMTMNVAQC
jgi:hypothetical protein